MGRVLFLSAILLVLLAQGSSALTPVFVQTGKDVLLNVTNTVVLKQNDIGFWKFNKIIFARFFPDKEPDNIHERIEFIRKNYSLKLKNLQAAHSGVYTATAISGKEEIIAEYNVTVQDPVSPVGLTVNSVFSRSDSCNLTVTCSSQDSHISSTFRCDAETCSQEGGERSEVTASGASLQVHLVNDSIICNQSNQVSWKEDVKMIGDSCRQTDQQPIKDIVPWIATIIPLICIICIILAVFLFCRRRRKCKSEKIACREDELSQINVGDQLPDRTPTSDDSGFSPTSTYCLVGPHTGPTSAGPKSAGPKSAGPKSVHTGSTAPESLYAQVEKPART